jgi:hypothetical protein
VNNAIVFLSVVPAFIGVYLLLRQERWRKQELYDFISENLVYLDVGIKDVTRLQEKYFPGLPGAAEQLAAARLTHDTIARQVRGQLGLRTVSELDHYKQQLLDAAHSVNGLRRFIINRLTDEQLVAEGLREEDD